MPRNEPQNQHQSQPESRSRPAGDSQREIVLPDGTVHDARQVRAALIEQTGALRDIPVASMASAIADESFERMMKREVELAGERPDEATQRFIYDDCRMAAMDGIIQTVNAVVSRGLEVARVRLGDTKVSAKDGSVSATATLTIGARQRFLESAGSTIQLVYASASAFFGQATEPDIVPDQAEMGFAADPDADPDAEPDAEPDGPAPSPGTPRQRELEDA